MVVLLSQIACFMLNDIRPVSDNVVLNYDISSCSSGTVPQKYAQLSGLSAAAGARGNSRRRWLVFTNFVFEKGGHRININNYNNFCLFSATNVKIIYDT